MINPSEVMDSGGGGGPPTKKAKMVNGTTSNTTAQLTTQMSETSAEVSLNLESLLPDELVSSNDTPTNAGGGQQAQGYRWRGNPCDGSYAAGTGTADRAARAGHADVSAVRGGSE